MAGTKFFKIIICCGLIISIFVVSTFILLGDKTSRVLSVSSGGYIKWVNYNVPYEAMEKALSLDVKSHDKPVQLHWIEMLAYLATKYGGNFKNFKSKDLDELAEKLNQGKTMKQLTSNMKHYSYFYEAYDAILGNFVGEYDIQVKDPADSEKKIWQKKYGLKAFSPIAKGYGFSHYDDFGNSRSFGFSRKHLGNDLMGSIGTPIVAVESGIVEVMGWNMYGGWRIGIRSFDQKRYYYYAHLRKDRPFHADLYEGKIIKAGDVIGYLGMTGYSTRENVNNISTPHLHFGMQLIFDESQKESNNEIWIDVYNIVDLLQKNRSAVVKDEETRDFYRAYDIIEPNLNYHF
ncbi:MAG TPA: M23 family metallopeptidase [Ruminiclostridium sp.]|nr:M23 family metallopeptidase [Ruminiclostridium sp.]